MFEFSVKLPGMPEYTRALSRFAEDIADWTPFWDRYFRPAWYRHVETHYVTQGRSTGEPWLPLSERYGVWKQKHWPGIPIGVLSGQLRSSLTSPDDPNAIWEPSSDGLKVGTNVPYAMYMQFGTRARSGWSVTQRQAAGRLATTQVKRGGMPARPMLRVNDEFMLLMGKLLQEYSVKTLRAAASEAKRGTR